MHTADPVRCLCCGREIQNKVKARDHLRKHHQAAYYATNLDVNMLTEEISEVYMGAQDETALLNITDVATRLPETEDKKDVIENFQEQPEESNKQEEIAAAEPYVNVEPICTSEQES